MFVLIRRDRAGAREIREASREAQLAELAAHPIVVAGPTLDAVGGATGSMIVVDLPDRATAAAFAADDPYARAGLCESVENLAWRKVVG